MVVVEILGVVKPVPVPNAVPPELLAYQFKVPALATAAKLTVPASQRLFGVLEVMVGSGLIVATTAVRTEVQPALLAST